MTYDPVDTAAITGCFMFITIIAAVVFYMALTAIKPALAEILVLGFIYTAIICWGLLFIYDTVTRAIN